LDSHPQPPTCVCVSVCICISLSAFVSVFVAASAFVSVSRSHASQEHQYRCLLPPLLWLPSLNESAAVSSPHRLHKHAREGSARLTPEVLTPAWRLSKSLPRKDSETSRALLGIADGQTPESHTRRQWTTSMPCFGMPEPAWFWKVWIRTAQPKSAPGCPTR